MDATTTCAFLMHGQESADAAGPLRRAWVSDCAGGWRSSAHDAHGSAVLDVDNMLKTLSCLLVGAVQGKSGS